MSELLQSGHHPDADQLTAFAEHSLPPHEQEQTLAHLAICPDCRTIVRLSLPPVSETPRPQAEPVRPSWFFDWRLVLPVATALAGLALLFAHLHNAPTRNNATASNQIAGSNSPVLPPVPEASSISNPNPKPSPTPSPRSSLPNSPPMAAIGTAKVPIPRNGRAVTNSKSAADPSLSAGTILRQPPRFKELDRLQPNASSGTPNPGSQPSVTTSVPAMAPPPATSDAAASTANQTVDVTSAAAIVSLSSDESTLDQRPLPSHLPALSIVSSAHQKLAIDTQNTVYFSDDGGENWRVIPSQWQGRAVKVDVISLSQAGRVLGGMSSAHGAERIAVLGSSVPLPLQTASSTLTGRVTDPSGAVISGASVVVSDTSKSVVRTVVTDRSGRYLVSDLVPGSYQVEAQAPGFNKKQLPVTLTASQQSLADLTLAVGQSSETVTVAATPAIALPSPILAQKKVAGSSTGQGLPHFEITTDTGERWTSVNGQTWKPK